jgi:hypothetical protein
MHSPNPLVVLERMELPTHTVLYPFKFFQPVGSGSACHTVHDTICLFLFQTYICGDKDGVRAPSGSMPASVNCWRTGSIIGAASNDTTTSLNMKTYDLRRVLRERSSTLVPCTSTGLLCGFVQSQNLFCVSLSQETQYFRHNQRLIHMSLVNSRHHCGKTARKWLEKRQSVPVHRP